MVLLLSFLACQTPAPTPGELPQTGVVIETINGQPFTQGALDAVLAAMPEEARKQIEEQDGAIDQLQEQLITQELLYREALERDLHNEEKVKTQIALAEREALVAAVLNQVADAAATDEALKTWYDEHLVQFRSSEARFGQIVVEDEETALAVVAEIEGGKEFAEVAREKSIDPATAANGGDMGWIDTRQLPPDLSTFAATSEPGAMLEPRALPNGKWFLLTVLEKREEMKAFEDVKDEIKPQVQQEAVIAFVEEQKQALEETIEGASIEVPEGQEG